MRLCNVLSAVSLAGPALAAVQHAWDEVPSGWTLAGVLPNNATTLKLTIALAQQNLDQLEPRLLAVSTPGSTEYGKHMDGPAVAALFAPSPEAISSVAAWLNASGVTEYQVDGAFVDLAADLATVQKLLNTTYQLYQKNGQSRLRTLKYSVPDEVQPHVSLVHPTTFFGDAPALGLRARSKLPRTSVLRRAPRRHGRSDSSTPVLDSSCQDRMTPNCLKQLYKIGNYTPEERLTDPMGWIGYGSFLGQVTNYGDLFAFEKRNDIPLQVPSLQLIDGGQNPQNTTKKEDVIEGDLDAETIIGISHPMSVINYVAGGRPPFLPTIDSPNITSNKNEPYILYFRYLLAQEDKVLPKVISHSYGDVESSVPLDYALFTCNLIGQLSLRGVSVLFSSGDNGVGAGCLAPDLKTVEFDAHFPATCPWVTSVGSTANLGPEVAYRGSQGGFSKYFPRPSYQDVAIGGYLSNVSNDTQAYYGQYTDLSGRGFPDVAAHGAGPWYEVIYLGKVKPGGGSSAATALWAGIVGLLNDARARAGKTSSLGWLNPLLYAHGELLNDITQGYSTGCDGYNQQTNESEPVGSGIIPGARWNATKGWDSVSGLGTPDFEKLKEFVVTI